MGIIGKAAVAAWQREQNELSQAFVEQQMNISRESSSQLFDIGEKARKEGNAQALATIQKSSPLQQQAFLQGNTDARSQVLSGVPQFQNAILGGNFAPQMPQQAPPQNNLPLQGGILSGAPIQIGPELLGVGTEISDEPQSTEDLLKGIYSDNPDILNKEEQKNKKKTDRIKKRAAKAGEKYDVTDKGMEEINEVLEEGSGLKKRRKLRQFRRAARKNKKYAKKVEDATAKYGLTEEQADELYDIVTKKKRRGQKKRAFNKYLKQFK